MSRDMIVENTKIIDKCSTQLKLYIKEALKTLKTSPYITKQYDKFENNLKLFNHRPMKSNLNKQNHGINKK